MSNENTNQTLRDLGAALVEVRVIEGHPFAILPIGYEARDLETYLPAPLVTRAHAKLETADALIGYVDQFKKNETAIFIHPVTGATTAVMDYHAPAQPAWGAHRASYTPQQTIEWKRWMQADGQWMGQREFAEFIENNVADIVSPSGAEMLEIAGTLEAKTAVEFKSGVRLEDGTQRLLFASETTAKAGEKGTLDIPKEFGLALVPFLGGDAYPLVARFRYKIAEGKLTLRYQLVNPHRLVETAVEALVKKVSLGTAINPFLGNP